MEEERKPCLSNQDEKPPAHEPIGTFKVSDQDKKNNPTADLFACSILDTLNDENVRCFGYQISPIRYVAYILVCILSAGFVWLFCYWKPRWKLKFTCRPCCLLSATKVLLIMENDAVEIQDIQTQSLPEFENKRGNCQSLDIVNTAKNELLRAMEISKYPDNVRYFIFRHLRYFYNTEMDCFENFNGFDLGVSLSVLHEMSKGLPQGEREVRRLMFGKNIIEVEAKSYFRLFIEESANPFYLFQLFSCILWCFDSYYYYAAAIILTSVISIVVSTYQSMIQLNKLRSMISQSGEVKVIISGGHKQTMRSDQLVPGDVIVVPSAETLLHADVVLLNGTAIVNESMLTGESTPITKTQLPSAGPNDSSNCLYSFKTHKRHTLLGGTKVLQTRNSSEAEVLAVVTKIGFSMSKGDLIRSILFPKELDFKFYKDALKFVVVLCLFAIAGFGYTIYVYTKEDATIREIIIRSLDIFTIAIPPALPAAMAVGTVYALQRLKKNGIFCICPSRINVSGKLKLFCFDKTGTLTEDGLDLHGVVPCKNGNFQPFMNDPHHLSHDDEILAAMATCHSLIRINGELAGDPIDLKMFNSTRWNFNGDVKINGKNNANVIVSSPVNQLMCESKRDSFEVPTSNTNLEIIKVYPFASDLQRMGVITKSNDGLLSIYCKGAPEVIAKSCDKDSIPPNFNELLSDFTGKGYRVLAFGGKHLKDTTEDEIQGIKRQEAEGDLQFFGFIVMKNLLKIETAPVIKTLQDANIRLIMVTGDDILTAINIAQECGMVYPTETVVSVTAELDAGQSLKVKYDLTGGNANLKSCQDNGLKTEIRDPSRRICLKSHYPNGHHFAMTGISFASIRKHAPELMKRFLVSGTIFARMLPNQKAELVEDLQELGYCVGMCGDGANDCGALKKAQTGISLSEAEASVASPFTSQVPNIECVPKVIMEGRCSLVTAFVIFKYMALYSMIQYSTVLLLYYFNCNLGDLQFLFIDLFTITPFAITLSRNGPYHLLVQKRPLGSLVHPLVITSLVLQIFLQFAVQFSCFIYVQTTPFYHSVEWFRINDRDIHAGTTQIKSSVNTVLFVVSTFQYTILAIVFSMSKPYRDSIFKNRWLLACLAILAALSLMFLFAPIAGFRKVFHLTDISSYTFMVTLALIVCCHAILAFMIERHLVLNEWFRRFLNKLRCKTDFKNPYKYVLREIANDPDWPPLADK